MAGKWFMRDLKFPLAHGFLPSFRLFSSSRRFGLTPPRYGVGFAMMRKSAPTWLRGACAGLLVGGGALLCAGCVGVAYPGGPGPYYDYYYYPDWDVYFYPAGHIYYWNDGGHWRSGGRLPPRYDFHDEHHELLRLQSRQPWSEHHPEHGRSGQRHDHY
jgi:hypothetical protein